MLSIFYSLSLPQNENAESKLAQLLLEANVLAVGTDIKVGTLRILDGVACAMAQAEMNDDFAFARTVCCPPGADRKLPLGIIPVKAVYFGFSRRPDCGVNVGLAMYPKEAKFKMLQADSNKETPYDGSWYYWNFVDEYSVDEAELLKSLLAKANGLGIKTTLRDERNR